MIYVLCFKVHSLAIAAQFRKRNKKQIKKYSWKRDSKLNEIKSCYIVCVYLKDARGSAGIDTEQVRCSHGEGSTAGYRLVWPGNV